MKSISSGVLGFLLLLAVPGVARAQISDQELGEQVAESVLNYSKFSIFDDVNVAVDNRVVTLLGRVTTPQKKDEIGKRAARIDGIRELHNEIGVLPVNQVDAALRERVALAIYRHPAFWRYAQQSNPPIHIIIENQHITLTGEVDSPVDSMLAYSLAQVHGALSIENQLRIAGRRR